MRFRGDSHSTKPSSLGSSRGKMSMGCELRESQETTIARFLGGMNKETADMIERQPFVSLEDVIKLAIKVQRQQKRGQLTTPRVFNLKSMIARSTPQGSASRHFISEFPNWREVTIQNPHAVESEVEEAIENVCGVMSKKKVEYADKGEKLEAKQVVSSESKLEEQWECLENIPKEEFAIEDLLMVFRPVKPELSEAHMTPLRKGQSS
ncbi:hypothetical protein CRG98_000152 [Punica granatum]|uniref:Uncharacterized protein n=1 Tax=Punica granatum TaxID=22663 RepID=A0A2I0LFK9_PUNGR|nr:hypothetical protein CRG98_000152 [Punica granatum]